MYTIELSFSQMIGPAVSNMIESMDARWEKMFNNEIATYAAVFCRASSSDDDQKGTHEFLLEKGFEILKALYSVQKPDIELDKHEMQMKLTAQFSAFCDRTGAFARVAEDANVDQMWA